MMHAHERAAAMERFTISLDDELAHQFDEFIARKGYGTGRPGSDAPGPALGERPVGDRRVDLSGACRAGRHRVLPEASDEGLALAIAACTGVQRGRADVLPVADDYPRPAPVRTAGRTELRVGLQRAGSRVGGGGLCALSALPIPATVRAAVIAGPAAVMRP